MKKDIVIVEKKNWEHFEDVCDLYSLDIIEIKLDPKGKDRFYVEIGFLFASTLFAAGQSYEARVNGLLGVKSQWQAIKKIIGWT